MMRYTSTGVQEPLTTSMDQFDAVGPNPIRPDTAGTVAEPRDSILVRHLPNFRARPDAMSALAQLPPKAANSQSTSFFL
jgi:hypothetical protein